MFNFRYIFRLIGAFFSRFKLLLMISAIAGILFFFIIRFFIPVISGLPTQRIGITGKYTQTSMPQSILSMIGEGLTKVDSGGNVEPALASSWETPDKGKTWIFHLRTDKNWQDGKHITSTSIAYQFSDVAIEKPDDKTIIFKLQNPYSAFPSVVSRPTFKKGLLGSGEWQVKRLSLSGTFVDHITLEKKGFERVIYKFYPTEEMTKLAFELGEVDQIREILNPEPFTTWKNIKLEGKSNLGVYAAVFFNTQDKLLSEKNLRQALNYAINKEGLGGERAVSPISKTSWAYNPQVKPYNFDREKALEAVNDYKKSAKTETIEVTLTTPPLLYKQAEKIAKDWANVGISVNVRVFSGIPSEYQALLAIFDSPDDPDQYSIWHSTQTSTNITDYQNPRIDKLLEDGRSEIDISERKKIYLDFQRFLVEDSPAAFLYYPTEYTVSRR